jgi:hypothetical protein
MTAFIICVGRENPYGGKILYWDYDDKLKNRTYSSRFKHLNFAENAGMRYEDIDVSNFSIDFQGWHFDNPINSDSIYHSYIVLTYDSEGWESKRSVVIDPTWYDNNGASFDINEQYVAYVTTKMRSTGSLIWEERNYNLPLSEPELVEKEYEIASSISSNGLTHDAWMYDYKELNYEDLMSILKNPKNHWGTVIYHTLIISDIYPRESTYHSVKVINNQEMAIGYINMNSCLGKVDINSMQDMRNIIDDYEEGYYFRQGNWLFIGNDGSFYQIDAGNIGFN